MRLFRRETDLNQANVRPSTEADLSRVARLLRDGAHRYYGMIENELPMLLKARNAVVIESGVELWAVALAGRYAENTAWLRALSLAEGLNVGTSLNTLLPSLYSQLVWRGVERLFYAGDEAADAWLQPALRQQGYSEDTEVVVYEKRDLAIPDWGGQEAQIRPAVLNDLAEIIALDQQCFEAQWTKDAMILKPAIKQVSFFIIAENYDQPVGYAYATSHFGGRLVHLVRIAVAPNHRHKGIGVRLLAEVVRFAQQSYAAVVTLNTQAYNLQAQRLYRWFGFVPTGEQQTVLRYDLTNRIQFGNSLSAPNYKQQAD